MKKIMIWTAGLVLITLAACSQKSPQQQGIDLMNEYAEKIEKATTMEQVTNLNLQLEKKLKEIDSEANKDKYNDMTPEEREALLEAMGNYYQVMSKKAQELQ